MEEKLVTFEVAKLAKEKGLCKYFENINGTEYVSAFYSEDGVKYEETEFQQKDCTIDDRYFRSTQSLLQKWLREVHNIHIDINTMYLSKGKCWDCYIGEVSGESSIWNKEVKGSYEEALEVGLQEALKVIKI